MTSGAFVDSGHQRRCSRAQTKAEDNKYESILITQRKI